MKTIDEVAGAGAERCKAERRAVVVVMMVVVKDGERETSGRSSSGQQNQVGVF